MAALALTVLLALLWLAFVALGYWHGGWRQIVVLAAMLLSYAVLSEWAVPNGRDLATQFHWSLARATTAVGLLYLLGGTLVLGIVGSFALERPLPLTARERQCGAAMGVLNGGLLLALVMRTLRSYAYVAGGGKALRTATLSRFLIESIGYLLLAALALGVVAVAVGLYLARRREPASLAASEPVLVSATAPQQPEYREAQPVQAAPSPQVDPQPRPAASPTSIYATEPIIDWPTTPPPGTQIDPTAALQPVPSIAQSETKTAVPEQQNGAAIPAAPSLPQRVEPPMRYPVEALVTAHTASMRADAPLSEPVAPAPTPGSALPIVQEVDVATEDVLPVVREIDAATHDTPVVAQTSAISSAREESAAQTPANEGEKMDVPQTARAAPMSPTFVTETTPIPLVVPPPLSSVPVRRTDSSAEAAHQRAVPSAPPERQLSEDEAAKPRAGFARVAVARQPGQRVEQPPAPQPPAEPEPLHPPLPTGPRVHACPICGYPVRDHARYCPNCGSRQRP